MPDAEGTYEIAYTARDKAGNYGAEKTLKIKALKEPETSFGIGGNYRGLNGSEAVGKGSWLRIYAATAVSEIFADGRSEIAEAALYRDGELYKETSFPQKRIWTYCWRTRAVTNLSIRSRAIKI